MYPAGRDNLSSYVVLAMPSGLEGLRFRAWTLGFVILGLRLRVS